jgi:hypothetical protein
MQHQGLHRTRIEDLPNVENLMSPEELQSIRGGQSVIPRNNLTLLVGNASAGSDVVFKGSKTFSNGGTYDYDEGVCVMDD